MSARKPTRRWLARLSLLLAAVAVLAAGVLEPFRHLPGEQVVSWEEAGSTSRKPADGGHLDGWCAVCHVLGGTLPTAASTAVLLDLLEPPIPAKRAGLTGAARWIAAPPARAPPQPSPA